MFKYCGRKLDFLCTFYKPVDDPIGSRHVSGYKYKIYYSSKKIVLLDSVTYVFQLRNALIQAWNNSMLTF